MKQKRRDLQNQGFRTLLGDRNVVKVFHDCRQAAAALFYQKSIAICNVFDTQVISMLCIKLKDITVSSAAKIQLLATVLMAFPGNAFTHSHFLQAISGMQMHCMSSTTLAALPVYTQSGVVTCIKAQ